MKKLTGLLIRTLHLFTFEKPGLDVIHYSRLTVEGDSFFLFSWRMSNAIFFRIPLIRFNTKHTSGSAYKRIPEGVTSIELVVANLWYKKKITLFVSAIPAEEMIILPMTSLTKTLRPASLLKVPKLLSTRANANISRPVPVITQPFIHNTLYQS